MNLNMKTGVYFIKNEVNNKLYIGSTKASFKSRFQEHKKLLKKGNHHSIKLQRAWNKYGKDSFSFNIIEIVSKDNCRNREQFYFDTMNPEYNMSLNAFTSEIEYTKEFREKLSKAHNAKEFEVFDIKGNLIGKYLNQTICAEELGITQQKISLCLSGKRNKTNNYRFRYVGEDFKFIPKKKNLTRKGEKRSLSTRIKMSKSNSKNINSKYLVYKNNNYLGKFNTILEVSLAFNLKKNLVCRVVNDPKRKTTSGYQIIRI